MESKTTMGNLFRDWSSNWGLRGDPFLWEEMRSFLGEEPLPASTNQLTALLEMTFEKLVGIAITSPQQSVFVERYSQGPIGGMSNGHVCTEFWRDRVFPELLNRYVNLKAQINSAKTCRFEFYPMGCRYGSTCRFRHVFPNRNGSGPSMDSNSPSMAPGPGGFPSSVAGSLPPYGTGLPGGLGNRGQAPCIHFLRGRCTFGSACRFAHFAG